MELIKQYKGKGPYRTLVVFADYDENLISEINCDNICLISFKDVDWNRYFSPWPYDRFTGEGDITINELLNSTIEDEFYVAGYSLGGLMALYLMTKTDKVKSCASVSGSLWYPGLVEYLNNIPISKRRIYLSLGNKEANTKHQLMKTVGDKTEEVCRMLEKNNTVFFEYNEGNHFFMAKQRLLKGIDYILKGEQ